jgi:hypothetical protein
MGPGIFEWEIQVSRALGLQEQGQSLQAEASLGQASRLIRHEVDQVSQARYANKSLLKHAAIASSAIGRAYLRLGEEAPAAREFQLASALCRELLPEEPPKFEKVERFRARIVIESETASLDEFRRYIVEEAHERPSELKSYMVLEPGELLEREQLQRYVQRITRDAHPRLKRYVADLPGRGFELKDFEDSIVREATDDPKELRDFMMKGASDKAHYEMAIMLGLHLCPHDCWVEGTCFNRHPPCIR